MTARRGPARVAVLVLMAAVLVLAVLPHPARAATSSLTIQGTPPAPIEPGASAVVPLTVVYEYEGDGSSDGEVRISAVVAVATGDRDVFTATVSPTQRTVPVDDQERRATARFDLTIEVAPDAAAFRQSTLTVTATADESGDVEGSQTQREVAATVAYVPGFLLEPGRDRFELSDGVNRIELRGVNRGNARVEVQLEIVSEPVGVQVATPARTTVSHEPGSNGTTFRLTVLKDDQTSVEDRSIVIRARYWAQGRTDTQEVTGDVAVHLADAGGVPVTLLAVAGVAAAGAVGVWWWKFR